MTEEKKENQKIVNLIIISDSVGDTAFNGTSWCGAISKC